MTEPVTADEVRQYVLFRLGSEHYGLPIANVSSVVRYQPTTPVPRSPAAVEGVVNLRGRVIPVVSLARRLFDREFEVSETSRIIVAEGETGTVGLLVDAASEVATIAASDILPPPETALVAETAEAFEGVARHGDRLIVLLHLDKALPRVEYDSVSDADADGGGRGV